MSATGASYPPLPRVQSHPEAVAVLRRLGRGEVDVEVAYGRLREVVAIYLWSGASEGHGRIVGVLVAEAAVPPPWWTAEALASLSREWEALRDVAPSAFAIDRAVWQLNASLLLMNTGDDALADGHDKLFDEKLAALFPPSDGPPSFRE